MNRPLMDQGMELFVGQRVSQFICYIYGACVLSSADWIMEAREEEESGRLGEGLV